MMQEPTLPCEGEDWEGKSVACILRSAVAIICQSVAIWRGTRESSRDVYSGLIQTPWMWWGKGNSTKASRVQHDDKRKTTKHANNLNPWMNLNPCDHPCTFTTCLLVGRADPMDPTHLQHPHVRRHIKVHPPFLLLPSLRPLSLRFE